MSRSTSERGRGFARVAGAAIAVCLLPTRALAAPTAGSAPGTAGLIRPCAASDPARTAALAEIAALNAAIAALAPNADPAALNARIEKLAADKCLAIVDVAGLTIDAKTGLSLQTYWDDARSFFENALALGLAHPKAKDAPSRSGRYVFELPSVRRALTLETAQNSPLAHLLCPATDERCGSETEGWLRRAEQLFDQDGRIRHQQRLLADPEALGGLRVGDCETQARARPAHRRYVTYEACVALDWYGRTQFPIGRVRAPSDGWLLVEGRRGHYDFCDEVDAYDLTHGGAYIVRSCSALALRDKGEVDQRRTDRGRRVEVKLGHLPIANLREAVWMILLMNEVDRDVRGGHGVGVPDWLEVMRPRAGGSGGRGWGSASASTAQTTLRWRYHRRDAGQDVLVKAGKLTFPYDDNDIAEDHAVKLLQIAESAFVPGCPALPPPTRATASPPELSANRLDADRESLVTAQESLANAWREAIAQQKACASKPR